MSDEGELSIDPPRTPPVDPGPWPSPAQRATGDGASVRQQLFGELAKQDNAWRFGFFTTLRQIEASNPTGPLLGDSRRPEDEPIRLGQEPDLAFAASTLSGLKPARGARPPWLMSRFMGLFGPNGALPLHLTEYARDRIRNHQDPTFAGFADLLHHRVLSLFYRAWADARPAVNADRGEGDVFANRVAHLAGIGSPGLRGRTALPDTVRVQFAGSFAAMAATPDAVARLIRDQFGVTARVVEFSGHWQSLEQTDLCRLGSGDSRTATLGESAILGDRVWTVADRFQVVLGPMDLARYRALRPEREDGRRMRDLVRGLVGREYDFDFKWIVRREDVPRTRLDGAAGLGADSWLLTGAAEDHAVVTSAGSCDPPVLDPPPAQPPAAAPASKPLQSAW